MHNSKGCPVVLVLLWILKGKCAPGSFLTVLLIKCPTHHLELTFNSEYEHKVKEKQIETDGSKLNFLFYWRNKGMIPALSKLFLVLNTFY
jgi:hypothetical protein